jgi:hypothetical protein
MKPQVTVYSSVKNTRLSLHLCSALALGFGLTLSSCVHRSQDQLPPQQPTNQKKFSMYEWHGDGVPGVASIRVFLDQQKAYFYRDGKQVGWTYVASGKATHPTPSGSFRVMEKNEDKISNLYGSLKDPDGNIVNSDFNLAKQELPEGMQFAPARMPYYLRLTSDGVGFHVGKIPKPGAAASHGCIRLPKDIAVKFFENVVEGTPVTIYANTPTR